MDADWDAIWDALIEAGARAEFVHDFPDDGVDLIEAPGDPGNFGGYRSTFEAGLKAALPIVRGRLVEEFARLHQRAYEARWGCDAAVKRAEAAEARLAGVVEIAQSYKDSYSHAGTLEKDIRDYLQGSCKPQSRTVTTAEELDALPEGSIVLDIGGEPWQKEGSVFLGQLGGSLASEDLAYRALPGTVLHIGGNQSLIPTVSTVEELNALPVGSVIRAGYGGVFEKMASGDEYAPGTFWAMAGDTRDYPVEDMADGSTYTVLYLGT